jgi:hypothetical protein
MNKLILYILCTGAIYADIFDFQTIEKANQAYEKGDFNKSAKLFNALDSKEPTAVYDKANAEYKA